MKAGLVITMYDEVETVGKTLQLTGAEFERVVVVQSNLSSYEGLADQITEHKNGEYVRLPNLDTRTAEDKANTSERFDFIVKALVRNFSEGFKRCEEHDLDYVVAITGDTMLLHLHGIADIIKAMGDTPVACSRAMGQRFHKAEWSREDIADPGCPKKGRLQDESVKDFMPHMFIVTGDMIPRLSNIEVTNRWCLEQCIGDAIGDADQFVFSKTAYGFADFILLPIKINGEATEMLVYKGKDIREATQTGVMYNIPSDSGWVHGSEYKKKGASVLEKVRYRAKKTKEVASRFMSRFTKAS